MYSEEENRMSSINDFSITSVTVWYRCGECYGYFHSIPVLRYHYLTVHKMRSIPPTTVKPPPGALRGKIYTTYLQDKHPPPPMRNIESASTFRTKHPRDVDNVEEIEAPIIQEEPVPSPTDSGIQLHDGGSETHEEDLQQQLPGHNVNICPREPTHKTESKTSSSKKENTRNSTSITLDSNSCSFCNKNFKSLSILNFHLRKQHPHQTVHDRATTTSNTKKVSPPKIVIKITKDAATGNFTTSPTFEATANKSSSKRRSSRIASIETSETTLFPERASNTLLTIQNMEAYMETDVEGKKGNVREHATIKVCREADADSDSSTATIPHAKNKRKTSPASTSSSDLDLSLNPRSKKRKNILTDSDNSDPESVCSSPPKKKKPLQSMNSSQSSSESGSEQKRSPERTTPGSSKLCEQSKDFDTSLTTNDDVEEVVAISKRKRKPAQSNSKNSLQSSSDSEEESIPNKRGKQKQLRQEKIKSKSIISSSSEDENTNGKGSRHSSRPKSSTNSYQNQISSDSEKESNDVIKCSSKPKKVSKSRSYISSSDPEDNSEGVDSSQGDEVASEKLASTPISTDKKDDSDKPSQSKQPVADDIDEDPYSPPQLTYYGGSDDDEETSVTKAASDINTSGDANGREAIDSDEDLFVLVEKKGKKKKKKGNVKPFAMSSTVCKTCNMECQSSSALVHHMKKVHDCARVVYNCGYCGKYYHTRNPFNRHIRTCKMKNT